MQCTKADVKEAAKYGFKIDPNNAWFGYGTREAYIKAKPFVVELKAKDPKKESWFLRYFTLELATKAAKEFKLNNGKVGYVGKDKNL